MSKAIEGAVALAGAVGLGFAAFMDPALVASPLFEEAMKALVLTGVSLEAGAIADALTGNRGMGITTRQSAAARPVVYGEWRVGGVLVYESTTGSGPGTYNQVIVVAGHPASAITNIYLDGRLVYFASISTSVASNWSGWSDNDDHIGPDGQKYNFGGNVFISAWNGTQVSGDVDGNLTANDPNWAPSSEGNPWLGGLTYVYVHVRYDQSLFPQFPEVRITVQGREVWDPRTNTTGYSTNLALIVNDVLVNTQWGFGFPQSAINTDQLIAAANICDEQIDLANGFTESQYAGCASFDMDTAPGDIIEPLMASMGGRISLVGGQIYIWPAAWYGTSLAFDQTALAGAPQFNGLGRADLFNHVSISYTAPVYPYSVVGNQYDKNGYSSITGDTQDNFGYAYTRTTGPPYAQDSLHGYSTDQWTTADGGELWSDLNLKCTLSVATAQRLAKIKLLRRRLQTMRATLPMVPAAYQLVPLDVMEFSFAFFGWTDQYLEITGTQLKIGSDDERQAPALRPTVQCQLTSPLIYEWETSEELTVYDAPGTMNVPSQVAAPTDFALDSGANTALVGLDGVVIPRISATWLASQDPFVTQYQLQYQLSTASAWLDAGYVDVTSLQAYIVGVVAGQSYNVQIRALRANGAASPWAEIANYTVSVTVSIFATFGQMALAPNALVGEVYSSTTGGIEVQPFTAVIGSLSASCLPAGDVLLTTDGTTGGSGGSILPSTLYYVYYVDSTFAGGAIAPIATTHQGDYLGKVGYWLIGTIVTPPYVASGGGGGGGGTGSSTYRPSNYADTGSRTTQSPAAPYSGNSEAEALVSGQVTPVYYPPGTLSSQTTTYGECTWEDFPATTLSYNATLTVPVQAGISTDTEVTGSVTISVTIGGTTTTLATLTATTAMTNYTASVPSGTNLSSILVTVEAIISNGGPLGQAPSSQAGVGQITVQ